MHKRGTFPNGNTNTLDKHHMIEQKHEIRVGTTWQRSLWGTIGPAWSTFSNTCSLVSCEGADLKLGALVNEKVVKRVLNKQREMSELCDVPSVVGSSSKESLKPMSICRKETNTIYNTDCIAIIDPGPDQSMVLSHKKRAEEVIGR